MPERCVVARHGAFTAPGEDFKLHPVNNGRLFYGYHLSSDMIMYAIVWQKLLCSRYSSSGHIFKMRVLGRGAGVQKRKPVRRSSQYFRDEMMVDGTSVMAEEMGRRG